MPESQKSEPGKSELQRSEPEEGKRQKNNRGPSAGPANRRALIAAARDVFAAEGLAAPFNAIAKRAGVGQGSLYRHFPDRVAIAVAVFDENVDDLEAELAGPNSTIDDLLDRTIEQALVSPAFIDLIAANRHDARVAHLEQRFRHIAETVLRNARSAGTVGDHVEADDVLLTVSMLAQALTQAEDGEREAVARRARAIFHAAFAPRP